MAAIPVTQSSGVTLLHHTCAGHLLPSPDFHRESAQSANSHRIQPNPRWIFPLAPFLQVWGAVLKFSFLFLELKDSI